MSISKVLLGCFLVLVFAVTQVQADVVTPNSATATSEFTAFGAPNTAERLIDGSGLDPNSAPGVLDQDHGPDEPTIWFTDVFAPPATDTVDVEFVLHGRWDLSAAHIWNLNWLAGGGTVNSNWRGVKDFTLLVSPDLVTPYSSLGVFSLSKSPDDPNDPSFAVPVPAQVKALGAGADVVQRIKFEIISNFSADIDPNSVAAPEDLLVVGLSEVRFEGVDIPEPTALAISVLGGLSLGLLARRRRKRLV